MRVLVAFDRESARRRRLHRRSIRNSWFGGAEFKEASERQAERDGFAENVLLDELKHCGPDMLNAISCETEDDAVGGITPN